MRFRLNTSTCTNPGCVKRSMIRLVEFSVASSYAPELRVSFSVIACGITRSLV
jgi:hypothetical protein